MPAAGQLKVGRKPPKERTRLPEDMPSFATGYRIRLESLIILHEGEFSAADIAAMIDEDVKIVTNHLRDLWDAGSIEFVGRVGDGNIRKAIYRAVKRPYMDDEEFQAMSLDERQDSLGVHLQWFMAECLASYRNKKMACDKALCWISDEPNLDEQGREELHDFLIACWSGESIDVLEALKGVQEITTRATNRMAKSGEEGTIVVVGLMAFERGRSKIPDRQLPISKR